MYPYVKRFFDIVASIIALAILSPILLLVSLACRFSGEGYVLYRQRRIGLNNSYFDIIKFATMLKNSPNIGTGSITLRNDPRLLPMGKFLRKTKINELPQILNVIKGDMSWVGPRPLVDRTFNAYSEEIRAVIYRSKPGITGIGSVIFRDEEKLISGSLEDPHVFYSSTIAPYKGALELWYNRRKSFLVDLGIILLTGWVIIFPTSGLAEKMFPDLPRRRF